MADYVDQLEDTVHESSGQVQPEQEPSAEAKADQDLLDEILENYALVCSVESTQRAQEDEDLEFEGLDMWGTDARESRAEQVDEATGQKVPARPAIEVNLVEQKVQQLMSEARQARLGVSVQPKAGLANTKQSNRFKGLIRSIQADSGANECRMWALERTAKCGRGAYRIDVDYANDDDFDLDLQIKRILDQSTVYWDPFAVMADRADAGWVLAAEWISERERLRRWHDKPIIPTSGAFETANHPWFSVDDNKQRNVLIVTYYRVEYEAQHLVHHPSVGKLGPAPLAELPAPIQEAVQAKHPSLRVREVQKRTVRQYIVDGSQILEQDPWPSRYLPIMPTVGKEYLIKGKRSWKGLVTNVKSLNRGYNVTISAAVEAVGSMPRAPYIMAAGQDENFEEMWDDSPIKAYTRLYYNPISLGEDFAPPPQRQNLEPAIQGALLLARVLKDDIGSVSGQVDAASRAVRPYDRSGKAIEALQRQGSAGTGNYLDNLATVSMTQEGRVLIDMIPRVYDTPGRVIGVMDDEGEDESAIMIKVPFVHDEDGTPIPVPCPACQGKGQIPGRRTFTNLFPAPTVCPTCTPFKLASGQVVYPATKANMPQEYQQQRVDYVDFSEGAFKVAVAIGRNFATKQEEAMSAMSQLATAAPALVPMYADLWVRSMAFPGSTEIADRIKRKSPYAQGDEQGQIPPEVEQKFQALQMEHQQAMQALQQATEALKTDQVKMQGQERLLAMRLEAAEGLENLRAQHKLMLDTAKSDSSAAVTQMNAEIERMQQEGEQRHEVLLETLQQRHAETLEAIRAETKLAVAEETAKTERMDLFLEERARVGMGDDKDSTLTKDTPSKDTAE